MKRIILCADDYGQNKPISQAIITLIEKKREEVARMQLKTSEEKNKNIVRNLKHEIALMLTVLREQQILEEAAGGGTHE